MPFIDIGKMDKLIETRDIGGLIAALLTGEPEINREKAAKALGEIKDARAVEPLLTALKESDRFVRKAAAEALGNLQDARALEPLINALKDFEYEGVRWQAACALGKLKDARAVEPLLAALEDPNENVCHNAAEALGRIGEPGAIQPLLSHTKHDKSGKAKMALIQIGTPAVEPLILVLKTGESWEREIAAYALGEIKDARAVEPLRAALKENSTVGNATEALVKFKDASVVEPLIAALKDRKYFSSAADALGKLGDARAIEPLIAALKDSHPRYRSIAAAALEKLGWNPDKQENGAFYWAARGNWAMCVEIGRPAIEPLITEFKLDPEVLEFSHAGIDWKGVDNYSNAVEVLLKIGPAAVEPLIARLQKDADACVRYRAAEVLGKLGDARAVEPLNAAQKADKFWLREAATEALKMLGRTR